MPFEGTSSVPVGTPAASVTQQAALAAGPSSMTVEELIELVKNEPVEFTVEPGVVADVNVANVVYDIQAEVGLPTPAFDTDEEAEVKGE